MKKVLLTMLALASTLMAQEFKQDEKLLEGQLENGLKYYIYPNEKPANQISVRLKVETGSLYEKEGEEGIAHFIEHMAFNGTEAYPKNELIRVLESRGVGFGHDLNAYTGFDETVFMLDGQEKDLDEFLKIMNQWGFKVTFDKEEVEKEKGVVIEEWRQETGLGKEVGDFYRNNYLSDTTYVNRLPIGKVPSIENFTKEGVESYYKRWYTPNNMSLFVVGDFDDVYDVEKKVVELFSKEKKKELEEVEYLKKKKFTKKEIVDKFIHEQLTDNSLSYVNMSENVKEEDQLEMMKDDFTLTTFSLAFHNRYSEKLNNIDTNLNNIYVQDYEFNDYIRINEFGLGLKDGKELAGIKEGFAEYEQLKKGFTEEEIEEVKKVIKTYIENEMKNIENIETSTRIGMLLDTDFDREVFTSYDDYLKKSLEIVKNIDAGQVNSILDELFKGKENYYLYTGYNDLAKEDIKTAINQGKEKDLGSYARTESKGEIITKPINKGHILEEDYNEEMGYYILTLSNGSKVYAKQTDYNKNEVSFEAVSKGGSNYLSTEDMIPLNFIGAISASAPGSMTKVEYERYTMNKNFNLSFGVAEYEDYFYGTSSRDDLDDMLMNYYAFSTEAKVDSAQLDILKESAKENIKNRDNLKTNKFWEEFDSIKWADNPRKRWMKTEDVEKVSADDILRVYNDRLSSGDFDYYIVGDFDYDNLKESVEKYIASLDRKPNENYKILNEDLLKHNVKLTRDYATGKESTVLLYFGDNVNIDKNHEYYEMMAVSTMDTELIKKIREEMGGVYSISSWIDIDKHNLTRGKLGLIFTCDPQRVDELVAAIDQVMKNILKGQITDETISYIKEKYKANYEKTLGTDEFYRDYLFNEIIGDPQDRTPEEFDKLVSKDAIIKFLNSIYGGYKGEFVVNPEMK